MKLILFSFFSLLFICFFTNCSGPADNTTESKIDRDTVYITRDTVYIASEDKPDTKSSEQKTAVTKEEIRSVRATEVKEEVKSSAVKPEVKPERENRNLAYQLSGSQGDAKAVDIMNKVFKKYHEIGCYKADYVKLSASTYEMLGSKVREEETWKGTALVNDRSYYISESDKSVRRTSNDAFEIHSNGKTTWIYWKDRNKVDIWNYSQDLNYFNSMLEAAKKGELEYVKNENGSEVIDIAPSASSQTKYRLFVNENTHVVRSWEWIVTYDDERYKHSIIRVHKFDENPSCSGEMFSLSDSELQDLKSEGVQLNDKR